MPPMNPPIMGIMRIAPCPCWYMARISGVISASCSSRRFCMVWVASRVRSWAVFMNSTVSAVYWR